MQTKEAGIDSEDARKFIANLGPSTHDGLEDLERSMRETGQRILSEHDLVSLTTKMYKLAGQGPFKFLGCTNIVPRLHQLTEQYHALLWESNRDPKTGKKRPSERTENEVMQSIGNSLSIELLSKEIERVWKRMWKQYQANMRKREMEIAGKVEAEVDPTISVVANRTGRGGGSPTAWKKPFVLVAIVTRDKDRLITDAERLGPKPEHVEDPQAAAPAGVDLYALLHTQWKTTHSEEFQTAVALGQAAEELWESDEDSVHNMIAMKRVGDRLLMDSMDYCYETVGIWGTEKFWKELENAE